MRHTQRYISSELSHFVGKGKAAEEQYDILAHKILEPGWLTHHPHNRTTERTLYLDASKDISTDEMLKAQVICFCDIPNTDLEIHVKKYSKFGLSFKKNFLLEKGACPVFYVANETPVSATGLINNEKFQDRLTEAEARGYCDRALLFDAMVKAIFALLRGLDGLNADVNARYFKYLRPADFAENEANLKNILGLTDADLSTLQTLIGHNTQAVAALKHCTNFLCDHVFSFIKCFNAKGSFEDEPNYYMEREWRVTGNVKFSLSDVHRIFLPSNYAARFRADVPSYIGQITFID